MKRKVRRAILLDLILTLYQLVGNYIYIEYFILIIILICFYVLVGSAIVQKYDVEGIPLSNLPEPGDVGAPG